MGNDNKTAAAQEAVGVDDYDDAMDQLWKLAGGNDSPVYKLFLGFRDSFAAPVAAAPVDLTNWAAHYSINPAALEALQSMLTSTPAAPGIDLVAHIAQIEEAIEHRVPNDVYAAVHGVLEEMRHRIDASPKGSSTDAKDAARYRHLQKVTPFRFKKLRDTAVTDAVDVLYFHADRFDAALDAHMQATSAEVGS